MTISRTEITNSLVNEIKNWPFSVACWEGGSAANQRADSLSDLDLVICVEPGTVNDAFTKIESLLNGLSKVEHIWRVPEPTWHGHGQSFYKLADTPEHFFLDIVIMDENAKQRFLEKERHGTAIVFFDKKNFIHEESANTADFWSKRDLRLRTIGSSFPFFKTLVQKEIARKRPIDAMAFYRTFVGFLVELYGMKYRPYRYDFGLRYLHTDFPEEIQNEIEKFLYVSNLTEIQKNMPVVENRISLLLTELRAS
jgi:hypothetical protein